MPNGRTDYFLDGKYGLSGARAQYNQVLSILNALPEHLDRTLSDEAFEHVGILGTVTTNTETENAGIFDYPFGGAIRSRRDGENAKRKMKEFRRRLQRDVDNPSVPTDDMLGYIYLADKIMDGEAGDYGLAMTENPYLALFISQGVSGPKDAASMRLLYKGNPNTQDKEGPMRAINNFFFLTSRLLQREYDKQEINRNYTVAKEENYLKELNADLKSILTNHKVFDKYVKDNGTSDYDDYLMNGLDVMTGKNPETADANRSVRPGIENIKGQQKAIDNGWGMNELNLAGQISEMAYKVTVQRKKVESKLTQEYLEHERNFINQQIAENQNDPGNLQIWQERLNQVPIEEARNRAKLERYIALEKELGELDREFKSTNVKEQVSAKYPLVDKFEKLATENIEDPVLGDDFKKGLKLSKIAMEYGGIPRTPVKISQEVKETTIAESEYDKYNAHIAMRGANTIWAPVFTISQERYGEAARLFNDDYMNESMRAFPDGGELGKKKYGSFRAEGASVEIKQKLSDGQVKLGKGILKALHGMAEDSLFDMKGARKEVRRCIAPLSVISDQEKGNFTKAMSDNLYLYSLLTQMTGNSPEIYLPDKCSPEEAVRWLKENEVLEPYNALFDAGKELFEIEYEKQRLQKTGWDETKERYYLAMLEENINKTEKAMETLLKLPLEVQEDTRYLGNAVGQAIGNDSLSINRDCLPTYEGLRWMREGIKNGWNSGDLNVLMIGGMMEGNLRRAKLQAQNKITKSKKDLDHHQGNPDSHKKRIDNCKNLIAFIDEFEKMHFNPLKESVLGQKIKSPADVIKVVNRIRDFYNKFKNEPMFSSQGKTLNETYFDLFKGSVEIAKDRMFPDVINRNLKEIEKEKKTGPKPAPDRKFKYINHSRKMSDFLNSLRNHNNITDKNFYRMNAQLYFLHRFLHGMNEDAHPELFDKKHPDYKAAQRALAKFTEQYADRLVDILNPQNTYEFANALEYGNHEDVFAQMRERIPAEVAKARYEAFIKGKPSNKTMDKNLSNTKKAMERATAKLGSGSDLYDKIEKGIKELEEMKNELAAGLAQKSRKDHRIYISGYGLNELGEEDKNQPIYKYENETEMKFPPEKLKKFTEKQDEVFKNITKYLSGKDALIRQKGGDPANKQSVELLGTNGERRYKAVTDAKKAVVNLYKVTQEYNEKGYSYGERRRVSPIGFDLNPSEYLEKGTSYTKEQEEKLRNQYIENEKALFEENLRYNIFAGLKEKDMALDTFEENEWKARNEVFDAFRKEKTKTVNPKASREVKQLLRQKHEKNAIKKYGDALVDSAIKTLYAEGLKEVMEEKKKNLFRNALKEELQENMKDVDEWFPIRQKYEESLLICEKYKDIPEKDLALLEEFPKIKLKYAKLVSEYELQGSNPPKEKMDEYHETEKKYNELVEYGEAATFLQKHRAEYEEKKPLMDEFITRRYREESQKLEEALQKNPYPRELVKKIKIEDMKALEKEYARAIADTPENRNKFKSFKENAVGKEPFKTEFKNRILKAATIANTPLTTGEVIGIRNDILKGIGISAKVPNVQMAKGPNAQNVNSPEDKILNPKNIKPAGGMNL